MRTVRDLDPKGKRILVRVDYNVPLNGKGEVADDRRIQESLPTLRYLLKGKGKVVLVSHLGRPKGVSPSLSLRPARDALSKLLGQDVAFVPTTIGEEAEEAVSKLAEGAALLLENVRFDVREEENDETFSKSLASLGDVFVEDAFGSVHRAHASTVGVARLLPTYAGLLVEKEVSELSKVIISPERPFVAVLGGAKVEDKVPLITNLLGKVDRILVGGAMGISILREQNGHGSLAEKVKELLRKAASVGAEMILPVDMLVRGASDETAIPRDITMIEAGELAFDIGPRTVDLFNRALDGSKTVFVNGPLGKAELPAFAGGTREVFGHIGRLDATRVLAGGDSASVVRGLGLTGAFTYVSTGGGAALEFLEGSKLPGLEVIPQ